MAFSACAAAYSHSWLCLPGLPAMHGHDKNWVIDRRLPFLHLSPIIMEVENGGLEDDFSLKGAIFRFHDYERKGKVYHMCGPVHRYFEPMT